MASESKQFFLQKALNMNPTVNGKAEWKAEGKLTNEVTRALDRLSHDLEHGILLHFKLKREQQLNNIAIENCYSKKDFTLP